MERRGTYGIDAPMVPFGMGCDAILCAGWTVGSWTGLGPGIAVIPLLVTLAMVAQMSLYLHATRRGKFVVWAGLLDELKLNGGERLLDLGCGRGNIRSAGDRATAIDHAMRVLGWSVGEQSARHRCEGGLSLG